MSTVRVSYRAALLCVFAVTAAASPLSVTDPAQPLRFFEGRTEMVSVVKVVTKKPYRSVTIGRGQILQDGSLALLQVVQENGKPARERAWRIRQVSADRFTGTMSEAIGPVDIERLNGRYRFSFRMKGHLAVEQWLSPAADGRSASSKSTVRKFGFIVASSEGTVRKVHVGT